MKSLFKEQLELHRHQADVLRIELKSGQPFKCKAIDVENDFFVILDEEGRYLEVPMDAVANIRNVTDIPGFEWKGE